MQRISDVAFFFADSSVHFWNTPILPCAFLPHSSLINLSLHCVSWWVHTVLRYGVVVHRRHGGYSVRICGYWRSPSSSLHRLYLFSTECVAWPRVIVGQWMDLCSALLRRSSTHTDGLPANLNFSASGRLYSLVRVRFWCSCIFAINLLQLGTCITPARRHMQPWERFYHFRSFHHFHFQHNA